MTRYELLKKNEDVLYQFVKAGILSYQVIRDIEIYEAFNNIDIQNKEMKYIMLSDDFELSTKRIEQIIIQMQK
ncbi:hypothetical protein [Flavobacterium sedimenticola]|uniref:Uncharacterized protein n=1 Tax=Flavobacterium sedimenticola TaxID=3043286 RepID=A0ABT6XQB2_9FLAO|nr:hypothetical protein [Flavobacterium sedimenticola]MDI9257274.1 hypothetical protein [Flavobacterium sedimenticola]